MARFSLAAVLLSALTPAAAGTHGGEDWEYLPTKIPTPLSDMGVVALTVGDGDGAKRRIIITGGCDSEDGNVFVEGGYFVCFSLSQKVCCRNLLFSSAATSVACISPVEPHGAKMNSQFPRR